jgi:hypothetical protein
LVYDWPVLKVTKNGMEIQTSKCKTQVLQINYSAGNASKSGKVHEPEENISLYPNKAPALCGLYVSKIKTIVYRLRVPRETYSMFHFTGNFGYCTVIPSYIPSALKCPLE